MKNDKLLETIVRSQASNAYYRTAEQAEYDNRNLDEIAEIVKLHNQRCGECQFNDTCGKRKEADNAAD